MMCIFVFCCCYYYCCCCFCFVSAGISALDIRTRLRITEAELAIVQREVVDLKTERKEMLVNSKQFEESWRCVGGGGGCGY